LLGLDAAHQDVDRHAHLGHRDRYAAPLGNPSVVQVIARAIGLVRITQEFDVFLGRRLIVQRHDRRVGRGRQDVLRVVPVLAIGVFVIDRRGLDLGKRGIRETTGGIRLSW